jgi:hypothetical protein
MSYTVCLLLLSAGLCAGILAVMEIGRRMGKRRKATDAEGSRAGLGAIEGALFALLGLLIAFTFSGAAARFDARRQLIVEETNAIGTAYLRLDLLPEASQPALRESFKKYLDSRIEVYRLLPDIEAAMKELARSAGLQKEIWNQAVAAGKTSQSPAPAMLLLPALNQMIDITTTRTMAGQLHPPAIIFVMLGLLTLVAALLAGYGMAEGKARSAIHMLGFAAIMAFTIFVILDVEYPRLGMIRVDAFDQALVQLRQSMDGR